MVLKEKSGLKGRGINTKGVTLSPSKSFSIFFFTQNYFFWFKSFQADYIFFLSNDL